MNLFKRKKQAVITPEEFGLLLINISHDSIKGTIQILKEKINATEHCKLQKVEEELLYFVIFALDYWWTTGFNHTQEENRLGRQGFKFHLAKIVNMDILQDRLICYSHIVNEEKDYKVMCFRFGRKLSEFCDMSLGIYLLVLAPDLFTEALESLTILKSVRFKLR